MSVNSILNIIGVNSLRFGSLHMLLKNLLLKTYSALIILFYILLTAMI